MGRRTGRKGKREKQKDENPLHRNYGIWSNMGYILRNMAEAHRLFLVLLPIGFIRAPFMQYFWTFIPKFVIDIITRQGNVRQLIYVMVICCFLQLMFSMLDTYLNSNIWWRFIHTRFRMIQQKNLKIMRIDFEHLEDADVMDCYQKAERATSNNDEGVEGMMRRMVDFLCTFSVVLTGFFILGSMNPLVIVLSVAVSLVNFLVFEDISKKTKAQVWDPLSKWWRKRYYMSEITTDFTAAKDIRTFGLEGWLRTKYEKLMEERYEAQKLNERLWQRNRFASAFISLLSQSIIYAWLIYGILSGRITLGNFTLYLASFATFSDYMRQLFQGAANLLARSREVDDFRSFMDFEGGDEDAGGIPVPAADKYEFIFRNVSFRYPKAEKYALKNLNLTLEAGERLAVVGLNGAGKSTFIKLLLRLYEPAEGEILLNGVDVRKYNKHSYYKLFAPVFQAVELFAFPLSENVSMQSPEMTDCRKAEECLKDAGFKDKLKELPKGVHTEILKVIHDDGVDLSGGEKQKLALARALYKNAPVVVLDEPTAALDALAESRLYEDFDKLIGRKTAVYISHRLSSTRFCDHVAMFADGEMIEYGTHESLLKQNGEYAKMFHIQAQYYVEGVEADA